MATGELEEVVRRRLIPEMLMWQSEPEIFLSVELGQSGLRNQWLGWKFRRQIWVLRSQLELEGSVSRQLRLPATINTENGRQNRKYLYLWNCNRWD